MTNQAPIQNFDTINDLLDHLSERPDKRIAFDIFKITVFCEAEMNSEWRYDYYGIFSARGHVATTRLTTEFVQSVESGGHKKLLETYIDDQLAINPQLKVCSLEAWRSRTGEYHLEVGLC